MNFTSQICTTRFQSEQLLALGLKRETADMTLQTTLNVCYTIPFQEAIEYFENRHLPPHPTILPAWSLHRLIEIHGVSKMTFNMDIYDSPYEEMLHRIEIFINAGEFNKEYLEE